MDKKILVTYATTYGSTGEIAEAIAETIKGQGVAVDLQPSKGVSTLVGYDAVILGIALYLGHAHKDALNFLAKNRAAFLNGMPIAVFASGPLKVEDDWQEIRKMLDAELAKYAWLKPVSVEIMGGKFDPNTLRFPHNLLPAIKNNPPSDIRDWKAIRNWATGTAGKLLA